MDPRVFLYAVGEPYIDAAGLLLTVESIWPFGTVAAQGDIVDIEARTVFVRL